MASSVQSCVASLANAAVAGLLAPLVMHSAPALAITSAGMLAVGIVAWLWVKPQLQADQDMGQVGDPGGR
jgi:DHA1 family bicyclomycin/chloramphenicol resistance-like MFS transporter